MTVTGDQTLAQDLLKDLRETQAKLEGAQAEVASLKVLLALRTHQHDQAWQAAQRAAAQRDEARAAQNTVTSALANTQSGADGAAQADAMARAAARTDAVRIVLGAVLKSLRFWGLNRRRFQALVVQASRETPETGPEAERHAILLVEARRVLGRNA